MIVNNEVIYLPEKNNKTTQLENPSLSYRRHFCSCLSTKKACEDVEAM